MWVRISNSFEEAQAFDRNYYLSMSQEERLDTVQIFAQARRSLERGKSLRVEKDFEELFGLFNKHSVRYCIIGSYAVAFYAKPRYTKDIDILIESSAENSIRVVRALKAFGFESLPLTERDFRKRKSSSSDMSLLESTC